MSASTFYTVGVYQTQEQAVAAADSLASFGDVLDVDETAREITFSPDTTFESTVNDNEQLTQDAYAHLITIASQSPGITRVTEVLNVTDASDMTTVIDLSAVVAGDICGPHFPSWYARGQWPRCACGYSPHDNVALTKHWEAAGFTVIDNHGTLEQHPL